jgi:hypothetical protein
MTQGYPYKNEGFEKEMEYEATFLEKLKCKLGYHDYVYHSSCALSRNSLYYGEVCKVCGKNNITWFGRAHSRRSLF